MSAERVITLDEYAHWTREWLRPYGVAFPTVAARAVDDGAAWTDAREPLYAAVPLPEPERRR